MRLFGAISSKPPAADRFYFWPAVLALLLTILFFLIVDIPGSLGFDVMLTGIFWFPLVCVIVIGFIVVFAVKRNWLKMLSAVAVPLIIVGTWQLVIVFVPYLHLLLFEPVYAKQIASYHERPGKQFAVFDWSIGFAGGPAIFLIFDDSDEIGKPYNAQLDSGSQRGFGPDCDGKSRHLLNHYYLCNF